MVEVGDGSHSRELCGGIHVRSTAEIGLFTLLSESSSAANVRRIEAITGPQAIRRARERDRMIGDVAAQLRVPVGQVPEAVGARDRKIKELEKAARAGGGTVNGSVDLDALASQATEHDGALVLTEVVSVPDDKLLLDIVDRLKGRLGDAAIVLGAATGDRVHLVASVAPSLVDRGIKAGAIVKIAAEIAGGGGGGRDTMARAGGRDPQKLPEAIAAARAAIDAALAG